MVLTLVRPVDPPLLPLAPGVKTASERLAEVRSRGQTGVEMEALTAVSIACLTIYDMCKAIDKGMRIEAIGLDEKIGGKSGKWSRQDVVAG